jgi:hypothetical protein
MKKMIIGNKLIIHSDKKLNIVLILGLGLL